jgi:hypothetical protein
MGIVSRFERRLQGAVGDVFARVFGGNVVPQEVEAALQREAADNVRDVGGGHLLAPNSYVITINSSDHRQLDADHDLTTRAFAKHLQDYIREQGWQTYGEVHVAFEASPTLHTGMFRTSGRVDPDAGRGAAPAHRPEPLQRPANPQPGAGPMTQNSGYDPSREHAESDPRNRGYAPGPAGRGPQNGAYPEDYGPGAAYNGGPDYQNGYDYQQGGAAYDQQAYGAQQGGYDPGYGQPGYAQPGYDQGYDQQAYGQQPGYDQGYDQQAYGQSQGQGYPPQAQQAGYGAPGGYAPAAGPGFSATLALDDGSGRTYQLREGSNIIGRGQDAHFRLPDTGVSRRHIEVRWDGQTAMLSDLGSTNGTLVNGSPVQDWQLADGDVIRAGHSEILIRIV